MTLPPLRLHFPCISLPSCISYQPPTCAEIYGNSLFASFKGFRIILLPPFLLPLREQTYFTSHSTPHPPLVPSHQPVLSPDSLFLLFDTNEYICTGKYERIQV